MTNNFFKWLYSQTRITRLGIYYLSTIIVYFISRAVSIMLGWNSKWI